MTMSTAEPAASGDVADAAHEEPAAPGAAAGATYFPLGADPATVIGTLLPLAQSGDSAAACRVALERLACESVLHRREEILEYLQREEEKALDRTRHPDDPAMSRLLDRRADRYAALQIQLIERERACKRVPEALRLDSVDWLRRAALAGHLESMLRYATGQSLGIIEGLDQDEFRRFEFMGHPEFDTWRRQAPSILNGMLADGRPEAAFVLLFAYSDDATPLSGLIRDDPVEAAVMRLVLKEASPMPSPSDPLRGLDARQRQAAITRHATLRDSMAGRKTNRRLLEQGLETPWLALQPDDRNTATPCRR